MNIFILDYNVKRCAQYHCDKHVIKMALEAAQLLCTAHYVLGTSQKIPYNPTHVNHPCAIWTRKSRENYEWLADLGIELCLEYTFRYLKIRPLQSILEGLRECSSKIQTRTNSLTPFVQGVPTQYKSKDPVIAYRKYYLREKSHLFSWKRREKPLWIDTYHVKSSHDKICAHS